jgi:hypothetical protein
LVEEYDSRKGDIMEAKHETGGPMELSLSEEDIASLREGNVCETDATDSGLIPFIVMEHHQYVGSADANLYGEQLGIYIHKSYFVAEALREAVASGKPIVTIPRNRIQTAYESETSARDLFGDDSTISINPQMV